MFPDGRMMRRQVCCRCLPPRLFCRVRLRKGYGGIESILKVLTDHPGLPTCHPRGPCVPLPRQSPRGGRQQSISPQGQWFSQIKTAQMRGFKGFYPLHHSGVVWDNDSAHDLLPMLCFARSPLLLKLREVSLFSFGTFREMLGIDQL